MDAIDTFLDDTINRMRMIIDEEPATSVAHRAMKANLEEWEALREIYDLEGFGGREYGIETDRQPSEVVEERLQWLRDQRAEGLR